jgi:PAS domain S-box-containing protein
MTLWRSLFNTPEGAGDLNAPHRAGVLNRTILLIALLNGVGLIATVLFFERKAGSVVVITALLLLMLAAKIQVSRGQVRRAAIQTVSGTWLIFAVLIFMGGGLESVNLVFFISFTVVAGLLLGERASVLVCAAGIATGLVLALLALGDRLPARYFMSSPLGDWAQMVFALVLTTGTLNLALRERDRALNMANRRLAERLEAEQARRESEELSARLVAAIPDLVVRTDMTGAIQFVNEMVLPVSGYSRQEIVGRNMLFFLDPEDRERAVANTLLMTEHRLGPKIYRIILKDGRRRRFEVNGDVLRTGDGTPYGLVHVLRDITDREQLEQERRELQERLYRAEKMEALGTLAGGVAHDLNNVLGVLVGYSELLLEKVPREGPSRAYVADILKSGERGAAIIQDLLTLARRGVAVSQVVNLNAIISDCLSTPEFEQLRSHHPGVEIRTEAAGDLLNVKGSPVHLGKTLMNLASNAAEAIEGPGEIVIRTRNSYLDRPVRGYDTILEGDYAVLEVSDTGKGIPDADIGKIFEPFYTKKVMGRSGTGLGLAVVWGTVKDHRGYIDVRSEPDRGTAFTLYFPVTREAEVAAAEPLSPDSFLGKGETILVVDDVPEQREVAKGMLSRLGYLVGTAASGEEAIDRLKRESFDLLVLDMIMDPGIDGLETYRRIVAIRPGQRAIIVSGFSETDRVRQAQALGAGEYVQKPYLLEKIGLAVRRQLGDPNAGSPPGHRS